MRGPDVIPADDQRGSPPPDCCRTWTGCFVLADMVGHVDCDAIHALYEEEYAFIVGRPGAAHGRHRAGALYDRLEQMLGSHHSMAPGAPGARGDEAARGGAGTGIAVTPRGAGGRRWRDFALRRALYRLHAILKVHLAEEELYLGVLDREPRRRPRRTCSRAGSTTRWREPL